MARYKPVKGYRVRMADGTFSPTLRVDFWHRKVRVARDTGCSTDRELQKWANRIRQQIDRDAAAGLLRSTTAPPTLKMSAAMERFVTEVLGASLSYENNEKWAKERVVAAIGPDTRLTDIRTATVMAYVVSLREKGLAPSSIRREMNILRALLNHATEIWEMDLPTIAWRRVLPEIPERVKNTPTAKQVARLLENATPRLARVIEMAVLTGLRHFEIENLEWRNIQILSPTDGYMTLIGKGNKETKLPLSSAAISLLLSIPRGNSSRVFDMTNWRREWHEARKLAGLSNTRFHDLRHAFATWLDQENAPVQRIKTAMRHSDIATSLIYVDAESQKLLPFLEKVGERLRSAKSKS